MRIRALYIMADGGAPPVLRTNSLPPSKPRHNEEAVSIIKYPKIGKKNRALPIRLIIALVRFEKRTYNMSTRIWELSRWAYAQPRTTIPPPSIRKAPKPQVVGELKTYREITSIKMTTTRMATSQLAPDAARSLIISMARSIFLIGYENSNQKG